MEVLENLTYDELNVGDTATYSRRLTEEELILFAAVSGDVNPIHLDPDFASRTIFKERIAHGMWSGALISAALATIMPGPGTIYLEQTLKFKLPVKLQDVLSVKLTVTEKLPKNRVVFECIVTNQDNEVVVEGSSKVIAPTEKLVLDRPSLPKIIIGGAED